MAGPRALIVAVLVVGVALGGVAAPPAQAQPAGYPIRGIDVSAFQGSVNWASVASGGALFAYIRASEQANIPDASFGANYQGARANGLFAGAYHRARPDVSSGRAQADFFLDRAQHADDGRTLPPMLDIEWPRSTWTGLDACYNMTPAQLVAWIRDFVDRVAERTGRLAMIYTNPNWWNPCTANNTSFGRHPLYNSGYLPAPPAPPAGWSRWTFWQYDDAGPLPGGQDVFNGDFSGLIRVAGGTPRPIGFRATVNGGYVTAENMGTSPLIAGRGTVGAWEQFHPVDLGGGVVALRANVNGRFVTAENGGASPLIANRTIVRGSWERFRIVTDADGSISLQALANGRYVTAEDAGRSPLIANRTAVGGWERFRRVDASISLRARANGLFVTAEKAGASPLIANRGTVGVWEQFHFVDLGGGRTAVIANANGRYVAAENAGRSALIANRTAVGLWEQFRVITNSDGSTSLQAVVNGRYVTAENAGRSPLIANRTAAAGSWERFERLNR